MKLFERLSSKMAKSASVAVKEEVKNTALDILPTLIGIGGMILGGMVYRDHKMQSATKPVARPMIPDCSTITITTNNYYFGDDYMKGVMNHGGREETQHIPASHDCKQ